MFRAVKVVLVVAAGLGMVFLAGCESKAQTGAGVGALGGAGAGAIIGNQSGNAGTGALIARRSAALAAMRWVMRAIRRI